MSNAPPPLSPPPVPPSSAPPAPPLPAMPSIVPITFASGTPGDYAAISVPPGVTITQEPPPPTMLMQVVASLADTVAIAGLLVLMARHDLTSEGGVAAIVAVLAARTKPIRLGAQAVSGVATLLVSALGGSRFTAQKPQASPPASAAK